MSAPIIQARGVVKIYHDTPVLRSIHFAIQPGDFVCVIGPSGCGKSTLLRCLNALERLDGGTVVIDGVELTATQRGRAGEREHQRQAHEVRQHVGMVFQSFNLFPHMTVLENIELAPAVVQKKDRGHARTQARELLAKVGLEGHAERYPDQLSGGQKQRAAIARALALSPRVMLYDEPTSALDPELVGEVLQTMVALDHDGMTQVVVTHEMGFAREAADYVIFMDRGEIVEVAPPKQLFESPQDPRTQRFLARAMRPL